MLCDLFGAQGGVLEHNVSVDGVKRHKRSSLTKPPPSVLAAYADEPALAVLHLELRDGLRIAFTSALLGVLPRA